MTTETLTQPQRITERRRSAKFALTFADLLELAGLCEEVEGRPVTVQRCNLPDYPADSPVPIEDRVVYCCEISWPEEAE